MTIVPVGIHIDTSTARSGARDLDALVPAAQRVERAVDKMSASVAQDLRAIEGSAQGASKGFASLGGGQIQNVAWQVGDFATQVGAGTSASVALAMQLPQLLGGFGALGAVLGAVVAIGAPLATSFFSSGKEAKDLGDHVKDLEGAMVALSEANDDALTPLDDLRKKYRGLTDEIIENSKAMVALRTGQARDAALGSVDAFVGPRIDQYARQRQIFADSMAAGDPDNDRAWGERTLENLSSNLREMERQLQLNDAEAVKFARSIQALGNATTTQEILTALISVRDQIGESETGFQGLTGASAEFGEAVLRGVRSMADLGVEADRADQATDRLAGSAEAINFDNARRNAALLTSELMAAQRAIAGLMSSQAAAMRSAELKLKYAGDPVGLAGATARMDAEDAIRNLPGKTKDDLVALPGAVEARARAIAEVQAQAEAAERAAREAASGVGGGRKGRGGGGRGGKSDAAKEAEKAAREMERQQEAQKKVEEGLTREIELVGAGEVTRRIYNETFRAGVDLYSEAGQKIAWNVIEAERLNAEWERLTAIQEYAADTGADLFLAATQGADSFGEAIRNVAAELAQMAAQQAFMTLFMGQGGKGGGIFQSILGSVLGGGMPVTGSFANGTPPIYATGTSNHPGGPAIINDRGGEIVDLPSGARVYPHDVSMRMAQAQSRDSTHVTVGVEVDGEGSIRAFVKDQVTKSEKRAVRTSVGAVRKGDASSRNFWKRG